jgi:hypothetical protein|tara:strand:- start:1177 stop:1473 length:297 start_codon:yes stop_codon:yes gene_type:complete
MEPIFKIGDLVKPTAQYCRERKHTASQCKLGVVIGFRGEASIATANVPFLYKVYWWPHNTHFFFPSQSLELVSRTTMDLNIASIDDIIAELQDKAEVL